MLNRAKKFLTIQMMAALEPAMIKNMSEKKALKVFRKASSEVPAYKQFLEERNVDPSLIKTIEDFKNKVPVSDKANTFKLHSHDIEQLFPAGEIKNIKSIITSSGHTGNFSFGLTNEKETAKSQETIDFMLDYIFNVNSQKTLLVNCLPMGIKVNSSKVTVADTSVRSDIVLEIIKTFSKSFDQTILIGENSFVKKVLEDGLDSGFNFKNIRLHLVLGEELLPENLRSYLANILGTNPDDIKNPGLIASSFGVAEFGLNLFYETKELIRIRRLINHDMNLRKKIFGNSFEDLPALLHYNPLRIFVEELNKEDSVGDLLVTNLDADASIPLIRYNIKDEGRLIQFNELKDTLDSFGYSEYVPRIRMPLVMIWGRDKILTKEGISFRPEFIKEILYQDRYVAGSITGNFKLSNSKAGLRIEIQTKENAKITQDFENKIRKILQANIRVKTEIIIYPYRDFPHGMELNYEKKFQYI